MGVTFNPFTGELMPSSSGGGGSDANAFAIIQPDAGTSPTADATNDTLTMTSADGSVVITGNATTDTVDYAVGNHSAAKITTGTLPEARGGTNQSTYATGDTLYASAANTLSKLAAGSTGQRLAMLSTGIPAWRDRDDFTSLYFYQTNFGGIQGATNGTPAGWTNGGSGTAAAGGTITTNPSGNGVAGFFASSSYVYAGTTSTGWAAMYGNNSIYPIGIGITTFETVVKILNLSKATDRFLLYVGLCPNSTTTAAPTDGIFFSYSDNVNSGKWQFNCANASTVTSVDTGISASTGVIRLAFVGNAAGTSWQAYINGSAVGTPITTNIPASTASLAYFYEIRNTAYTSQVDELCMAAMRFQIIYTTPF